MAEDPFIDSDSNPTASQAQTQHPPHIHRPIPRRNFSTNSNSQSSDSPSDPYWQNTPPTLHDSNNRTSDFLAQLNARLLRTRNASNSSIYEHGMEGRHSVPTRNKSFLNMTSSTLFGIYDDVGSSTAGDRSEAETPWGMGAETPGLYAADSSMGNNAWENGMGSPNGGLKLMGRARRGTWDTIPPVQQRPRSSHGATPKVPKHGLSKFITIMGKLSALFLFGLVYGVIVSHLHDTRELAAVRVDGVDHESWLYLGSWGIAGIVLGSLLPYVDLIWDGKKSEEEVQEAEKEKEGESSIGEQWNEVVRSVAAFVGIAFAIRRLPWQSTLQLTVTLALVNPALWYILDRSKPGLSFSLIATSLLTSFIFLSNPDVLPSPALPATTNSTHIPSGARGGAQQYQQQMFAGMISYDNLAVITWVGSVLFCSCVCFGNIGRRLAILDEWGLRK